MTRPKPPRKIIKASVHCDVCGSDTPIELRPRQKNVTARCRRVTPTMILSRSERNSSAEEAASVSRTRASIEPADDIVLTVLDAMARADLIDRAIPERFRTVRWQPPW